jgi:hypothetical protein
MKSITVKELQKILDEHHQPQHFSMTDRHKLQYAIASGKDFVVCAEFLPPTREVGLEHIRLERKSARTVGLTRVPIVNASVRVKAAWIMSALRWSQSRSAVRLSILEREEAQIARRFEAHNEQCRAGECCLSILEDVIARRIEFGTKPRPYLVWLSMPEKPEWFRGPDWANHRRIFCESQACAGWATTDILRLRVRSMRAGSEIEKWYACPVWGPLPKLSRETTSVGGEARVQNASDFSGRFVFGIWWAGRKKMIELAY